MCAVREEAIGTDCWQKPTKTDNLQANQVINSLEPHTFAGGTRLRPEADHRVQRSIYQGIISQRVTHDING
jgi:hypothetical protein